jgi:hypothetical protein
VFVIVKVPDIVPDKISMLPMIVPSPDDDVELADDVIPDKEAPIDSSFDCVAESSGLDPLASPLVVTEVLPKSDIPLVELLLDEPKVPTVFSVFVIVVEMIVSFPLLSLELPAGISMVNVASSVVNVGDSPDKGD